MNASELTMRAPSVARLASELCIDEDRAARIRHVWTRRPSMLWGDKRREIDAILETHGVEFLGVRRRDDARVYYCNAGDSYAATLVFIGSTMRIGCWADYAEARRPSIRFYNAHSGECC